MTENETTPGDEFADRRLLALPSSPPPIPKPNDRPARVSGTHAARSANPALALWERAPRSGG